MPYELIRTAPDTPGAVLLEARLRPHRSLPLTGFVWFIGGTAALFLVPLLAVIGSPVLWALLPFLLGTLWAIWWALRRSYRDGELTEVLTLTADRIALVRQPPSGDPLTWEANPYWVRVTLRADGPVPDYLTLKGADREVELGAFLAPEERKALAADLREALGRLK